MRRHWCLSASALVLLAALAVDPATAVGRELTFQERVAAQEAIERVYYSHLIGATRPFEEVVSREMLEAKVRNYLKLSAAMDGFWGTPIVAEALEAELDRMARDTRSGERLRELFRALGDDVFVIQECLARPVLASRLAHGLFASDERIHGAARAEAAALREALAAGEISIDQEHPRRSVVVISQRRNRLERRVGPVDEPVAEDGPSVERVELSPEEYLRVRSGLPSARGSIGSLEENPGAFAVSAILDEDGASVTVARWAIPKVEWDAWWETARAGFDETSVVAVASASVALPPPAGSQSGAGTMAATSQDPGAADGGAAIPTCVPDDTWAAPGRLGEPVAPRFDHTAVWTGSVMIVWGGRNRDSAVAGGDRYDPLLDSWTPISTLNAPSPRSGHTAVWTGSAMIVWGGVSDPSVVENTGARYDPVSDTWTPTSMVDAPVARTGHTAVWTGSEMIVWGGVLAGRVLDSGSRYDPVTDSWRQVSGAGVPFGRKLHTAVWTGTEMIVWGGADVNLNDLNGGGRYDPRTDRWVPVSLAGAPLGRVWHSAVWTGRYMVIWGGRSFVGSVDAGGRYDPASDSWSSLSATDAPPITYQITAVWTGSRMLLWGKGVAAAYDPVGDRWGGIGSLSGLPIVGRHSAVWTGSLMIVWGGQDWTFDAVNTGARYNLHSWTPTAVPRLGPRGRFDHGAVWTGTQMIVWAGRGDDLIGLRDGGRYDPALDTWLPMSTSGSPSTSVDQSILWTGRYVLIWNGSVPVGGRYDPARDKWLPISISGAPSRRAGSSSIWTGRELIVWGGISLGAPLGRGGRYDPATDTWKPISGIGEPSGRQQHSAVWTGREMIVWGGLSNSQYLNSGGRYDPATDAWRAIAMTPETPSGRRLHTAVWTGTEMIVWGGVIGFSPYLSLNTGGRYDPVEDRWRTVPVQGAPPGRFAHTAVWTGRSMMVWGGSANGTPDGNGARYDPLTDGWIATPRTGAPRPRHGHTAVWTGSFVILWGGFRTWDPFSDGGLYALGHSEDDDADGFSECGGDCNDGDARFYPGAPQTCDGFDTDCSSATWPLVPADERDQDRDGFLICQGDCDDTDANVRPDATESCNHVDDDCDGMVDEDPNGLDSDSDAVSDMCDNCRLAANPGQEDAVHPNDLGDACDDPDGDGEVDASDNCPDASNPGQEDPDLDGHGDVCDVCPAVSNPGQEQSVACIAVGGGGGSCLESGVSMDRAARKGRVVVLADRVLVPESITFEINVDSCERADEMEFFVNGTSVGTFRDPVATCGCLPPVQSLVVSDAGLLRALWHPEGGNTLGFTKAGSPAPPGTYVGSYLGWVRSRIEADGEMKTVCLLDVGGGDCTELNQCAGGYSEDAFVQGAALPQPFTREDVFASERFVDGSLPERIDITGVPRGPATLCLEAEADGALFAGGETYPLVFQIDPASGQGGHYSDAPLPMAEIEHDNRSGRTFAHGLSSYPLLVEFDLQTGASSRDDVYTGYFFAGLEFVRSRLYGAATAGTPAVSELRVISPFTGDTVRVGPTGRGLITGLAYDEDRMIMYASERVGTGGNLLTIDLDTGAAMVVGPLGAPLDSLEFGPDGGLFGGTSGSNGGRFYRVDTATGAASFIGATGFPSVSGLTLVAPIRSDCVGFLKETQDTLLINRTCNAPPSAAAGADVVSECSSPEGAAVVLDGSASADPDSSAGTRDDIALFEWYGEYGSPSQALLGTGETVAVRLPLGAHRITLKVTDRAGASAIDALEVSVLDTVPPVVGVVAEPGVLWPPNHRMVPMAMRVDARDACDPAPRIALISATNSEPDDAPGEGDGRTSDDVQVASADAPGATVLLRAERAGAGDGRTYSLVFGAADASGNVSEGAALVTVPRDVAGVIEPVDITLRQELGGTLLEWTPVEGALHYNVVRGEVAEVREEAGRIDLGAVTCIEEQSPDASTAGHEDPVVPEVGRAFFYLVEYSDGWSSSYGEPSVSQPRVIRSGACR